jgi:shikimate dehydrogenase
MNQLLNASTTAIDLPGINGSTRVCAVIGDPVEHTLSPGIHNAAFKRLKMDLVYVPFRVRTSQLRAAIKGLRCLEVSGINIMMPHKSRVLRFLDRIDKTAQEIGAVNTVVRKKASLHGYNTDGEGAVRALSQLGSLSGRKALILGAGGAAKAIAYYLSKSAETIVILNRTPSNGARLASRIIEWSGIPSRSCALSRRNLRREARRADLLINTLPVHAFARLGKIAVQDGLITQNMLVMDANYMPESEFLTDAKLAGAKAIDGLEMLIQQAGLSFKLWTGLEAPIDAMRQAAIEARTRR